MLETRTTPTIDWGFDPKTGIKGGLAGARSGLGLLGLIAGALAGGLRGGSTIEDQMQTGVYDEATGKFSYDGAEGDIGDPFGQPDLGGGEMFEPLPYQFGFQPQGYPAVESGVIPGSSEFFTGRGGVPTIGGRRPKGSEATSLGDALAGDPSLMFRPVMGGLLDPGDKDKDYNKFTRSLF
jgi:hypothetical protein